MTWYGSATPEPPRPPTDEAVGPRGYGEPEPARPRSAATFSATRLWTGGVVTAVIAALLAVVGFLIVGNVLGQSVLGVKPGGDPFAPSMLAYAFSGAVAALLATAVMHLLLVGTPRPLFYFGWIGALCTAILVLIPLGVHNREGGYLTVLPTVIINLIGGIAITAIVRGTAAASLTNRRGLPPVR
ncbi:hypothetical protein Athai_27790 [Actinocatenispora thailandica]|uniref:Uncharacterized protein n=1 Tax=Actinocatenispora thailandica TaxID=227318 RepID=A0A7R7DPC6_9ACTN|nr:hypothetical protein [Actinocatenispora thailandica]BCJ35276.1 hypothetical protein Athai_27790 [Actinocatenispora thailandica]